MNSKCALVPSCSPHTPPQALQLHACALNIQTRLSQSEGGGRCTERPPRARAPSAGAYACMRACVVATSTRAPGRGAWRLRRRSGPAQPHAACTTGGGGRTPSPAPATRSSPPPASSSMEDRPSRALLEPHAEGASLIAGWTARCGRHHAAALLRCMDIWRHHDRHGGRLSRSALPTHVRSL